MRLEVSVLFHFVPFGSGRTAQALTIIGQVEISFIFIHSRSFCLWAQRGAGREAHWGCDGVRRGRIAAGVAIALRSVVTVMALGEMTKVH